MKERKFLQSKKCFKMAKKYIPGGVNSPVRAFKAVGGEPLFIDRGIGAYIFDVDGNKYIDYVMSWGPMILGHADKRIVNAVTSVIKKGTSFGAPTKREIDLALLVSSIYPSIEKVRLTSSGTEAAMSAIRLARGFTKKEKIIKFSGCYHGHFDSLLVKAGSGVATFGVATSAGVNKSFVRDTIVAPFNDIAAIERLVKREKNNIACLIIEPIPANMGVVLPQKDFLQRIRKITKDNNIVLIFDEVISGFRVALGGAQELFNIKPDLTILGKIIGGGFPIGAFGGKSRIMDCLSPEGLVYQAGTLSGNPVAVEAGINTINILTQKNTYQRLENLGAKVENGLKKIIKKYSVPATVNRVGSLFTLFFGRSKIENFNDVSRCDLKMFAKSHNKMLQCGIYLAPSQFEANFISIKHTLNDINRTLKAVDDTFKTLN